MPPAARGDIEDGGGADGAGRGAEEAGGRAGGLPAGLAGLAA